MGKILIISEETALYNPRFIAINETGQLMRFYAKSGILPKEGQYCEIEYDKLGNLHHVEDVNCVELKAFNEIIDNIGIIEVLKIHGVTCHIGIPDTLFEKNLKWEKGAGFITRDVKLASSLQFWKRPNGRFLEWNDKFNSFTFAYWQLDRFRTTHRSPEEYRDFRYVGKTPHINQIDPDTLLLVQLSNWQIHKTSEEERCYVQIVKWF
jgi:hypothetical protein